MSRINNNTYVSILLINKKCEEKRRFFFSETFKADAMRQDASDSSEYSSIVEI